ncbi:hypothetical protein D3C76_1563430 [compost metagenome]
MLNPYWVAQTLASLPIWVQNSLVDFSTEMAARECASGATPYNVCHCMSNLLREAEQVGDLEKWRHGEVHHEP